LAQREIEESTNPSPINTTSSLEDLMDISGEGPRKQDELHEESYSFLVRTPVTSQKKREQRKSEILILEVIVELDSDDDGDDKSEEDIKRVFEDDVLEYSSDDSDEDF